MKYKKIGQTNIECSVLGLGCLHFGVYFDKKQAELLVNYSIDNGINFFDTGPLYGNGHSQKILGEIIKNKRKNIIISTKAGLEKEVRPDGSFGVKVKKLTPLYLRKSLEKSLKEINTDYIDLFQLHAFDTTTPLEETLSEIDKLFKDGLIRSFGVSNFDPYQLSQVNSILKNTKIKNLGAIECHYNMIERKMEEGVIPECKKNGVSIMPYRALARGILSGQYKLEGEIPVGSRAQDSWRVRDWLKPETLKLVNELKNYALENNTSISQLSLAWLSSKTEVCSVIIGVKKIHQLGELIDATSFDFSKSMDNKIDEIIKNNNEYNNVYKRPDVYFEK